jgi:hypothetical protein
VTPSLERLAPTPHRPSRAVRPDDAAGDLGTSAAGEWETSLRKSTATLTPLEAEISRVLTRVSGRVGARDRSDLIQLRCKRLARMYRELAAAGEQIDDIKQIGEHHATVLLRRWRERQRSAATIRSDWSILRVWCEAIGKPGCVRTLREYWPDAPRATTARERTRPARHGDARLVKALQADPDLTHYFVERLCQALRLSVQEALLLPICHLPSAARDSASARKLQAAMNTAPAEVHQLLHDAAAFLTSRERPVLMWTGLELPQAMRRHENRLAYLRRKLAEADEDS